MESSLKFSALIEELLAEAPRLQVVKEQMRRVGLKPGTDLVQCLEITLAAVESNAAEGAIKPEVENEV